MNWRWVQVAPHPNDTLWFASGIMLVVIFGFYPLLTMDSWLTEKLFGVIISILLSYATLDMKSKSQKLCVLALGFLYLIIKLATTKIPFLM